MYETREHIIEWIEKLKVQISEIDTSDPDEYYDQEKEACIKLISYLEKLENHDYIEVAND